MYHTRPPKESGWYWVKFVDNSAAICYWISEEELLLCPLLARKRLAKRSIAEAEAWIGPLGSPFGEQATSCAYCEEDLYARAKTENKPVFAYCLVVSRPDDCHLIDAIPPSTQVRLVDACEHDTDNCN